MFRETLFLLFWLLSTPIVGASVEAGGDSAETKGDAFREKLHFLHTQNIGEVGREAVVKAYEEFISEYADDPRVAEAMHRLGHRYLNVIPALGIAREPESAMRWFRKAAATATPGSEIWVKCQFTLSDRSSALPDARQILIDVAARVKGDSLTLAKVEHRLQRLCVKEGDVDAAEVHCRRLLEWYRDPARIPKESGAKADLDSTRRGAGKGMLNALARARKYSKAERAERIQALVDEYASGVMTKYGKRALRDLAARAEEPEFSMVRRDAPRTFTRAARVAVRQSVASRISGAKRNAIRGASRRTLLTPRTKKGLQCSELCALPPLSLCRSLPQPLKKRPSRS